MHLKLQLLRRDPPFHPCRCKVSYRVCINLHPVSQEQFECTRENRVSHNPKTIARILPKCA